MKSTVFFRAALAAALPLLFLSCLSTREAVITPRTGHLAADWLEADISYPSFEGYDDLNRAVETYVEHDYRDFKAQNQEGWQELDAYRRHIDPEGQPLPFAYRVSPTQAFEGKRYINVLLSVYSYTGGAHGGSRLKSFVYDKKQRLLVETPLQLGTSYAVLSEACRSYLSQQGGAGWESASDRAERLQWIEKGTAPIESNYRVFTYDGETLTVYFGEYQVAPYSEGILSVPVLLTAGPRR